MKQSSITLYIAILAIIFVEAASIIADENTWSTNGPYGGSIKTIAIHPIDLQTLLIGTVTSGIYKSVDGGLSWDHIDSDILPQTMREIAFHPFGPDTIFVASANGLFKSNDSGASWSLLRPPINVDGIYEAILVHPVNPNLIFAGGFITVWMSQDGGRSWYAPELPYGIGTSSFAVDRSNPDKIYMVASSFYNGLGVWKSADRGITWENIQNNIDTIGFGQDIEIDPSDPNILYLARFNIAEEYNHDCLSKSINGGESWFDITPDILTVPKVKDIKISPVNNNVIFICTSNDGVLKSMDGGYTWTFINSGLRVNETARMAIDSTNDILYLGTYHDGIYKSLDEGVTWQSISYNVPSVETRNVDICPDSSSIVVVAARNGLFSTSDSGQSWEYINTGIALQQEISVVRFDPGNGNILYCATGYNNDYYHPSNTGFYFSSNIGYSWERRSQGLPGNIHYKEIAVSSNGEADKRIFLGSSRGLFYSDDQGILWHRLQNGLPSECNCVELEVSTANQNIIGVADMQGLLFLSNDRGETWSQAEELPILEPETMCELKFHPFDSNHIYASCYYDGLFESLDGGESWTNISNNLPLDGEIAIVTGIVINQNNPSNMFVTSNRYGVFQTHDAGLFWESYNTGLDTISGWGDLAFAGDDTTMLYLASSTRSVWSIHRTPTGIDDDNQPLPSQVSLSAYPNPFNAAANISFSLPEASNVSLDIYDLLGRRTASLLDSYLPAGNHSLLWHPEDLAAGVYIYRLTTDNNRTSHKITLLK